MNGKGQSNVDRARGQERMATECGVLRKREGKKECPFLIELPANVQPGKAADDSPKTNVGELDRFPGFCLWPHPALFVFWGVNGRWKFISFSYLSLSLVCTLALFLNLPFK